MLTSCALLLWMSSSLLLDAFPVVLEVSGDDAAMFISVDGETRGLELVAPLCSLRVVPLAPHVREYQIDGSDSTNNFNLDADYFAAIANSPYYRLQSLLRDEESYSQWRRLEVRDGRGQIVAGSAEVPSELEVALPRPFLLSAQLHRIETPRSLEFLDDAGNTVRIEINRNDKRILVTQTSPGGFVLERAKWYFPNEWLPYAAEVAYVVLRATAMALAFALLLLPLAAVAPPVRVLEPWRRIATGIALLASAGVLAAGCFSAVVLFDRAPHVLDAISYYFQGKVFASGALCAPAPAVGEAFPTPFTVVHDGKWFSQYPPGGPLVLAVGFLLGVPWLVQPVMAAAATLLLYEVGRRQYGVGTGLLAAVLMASSPFLHLMSGSFLSHVPAMFFATCFLYASTRYLGTPSRRWVVAAGLALGGAFLCREVAALLFGLPVGAYLVLASPQRRIDRVLRDLWPGAAALALVGAVYLAYNWALTGSPLLLPRLLAYGGDRFGFGEGVGFYGRHTLAAGLVNTDELLTSLSLFLFGWPFYASLAIVVLPFILQRPAAWDRVHGAVVGLTILAYLGYFYHGIALGPRYYFDGLPSLVLLSARGFAALAATASSILQAVTGRSGWGPRARTAALLLCAVLMSCNLLYFTPRQVQLYWGFTGLPGGRGPELGDFVRRDVIGRVPALDDALVTTTDWWFYAVYLASLNTPRLDGKAVFALMPEGEKGDELKAAFVGRDWYRLVEGPDDRLGLQRRGRLEDIRSPD